MRSQQRSPLFRRNACSGAQKFGLRAGRLLKTESSNLLVINPPKANTKLFRFNLTKRDLSSRIAIDKALLARYLCLGSGSGGTICSVQCGGCMGMVASRIRHAELSSDRSEYIALQNLHSFGAMLSKRP